MKLSEYMATHDGAFTVAETVQPLTSDVVDSLWANTEIEPFIVGDDPAGHRKIHLYAVESHHHIATHVEIVTRTSHG